MNTLEDRIQQLLDERLCAEIGLNPDHVTVQSLDNGVLSLRMSPGCMGCGTSVVAVTQFLEQELPKYVPEVQVVEASY